MEDNKRLLVAIKRKAPIKLDYPSDWDWVNNKITDSPNEGLFVIEAESDREADSFIADAFVKYGGAQ